MTTGIGKTYLAIPFAFAFSDQMPSSSLTLEEHAFVEQLISLPLRSILDHGDGEKQCKQIVQYIYEKFRNENPQNNVAGKEGVQKILAVIPFYCPDGFERKLCIETVWDKIKTDASGKNISIAEKNIGMTNVAEKNDGKNKFYGVSRL